MNINRIALRLGGLSLVISSFLSSTDLRADPYYNDLNFLNNYNAGGCSGVYTGMTCRTENGGRRETPFEKAKREKLARERATTEATTRQAIVAIEDILNRPEELLEPHGVLPQSPAFRNTQSNSVICLRANLGSLFLLQEHPNVFFRLAGEISGDAENHSYGYGRGYAFAHALGMYVHAANLVDGGVDLSNKTFANSLEKVILSQLGPALSQMGYFTNSYELWTGVEGSPWDNAEIARFLNYDVTRTALAVGYRIGFFSDVYENIGYPFTDRSCGVFQTDFSNADKIREEIESIGFDSFNISKVLPNRLSEILNSGPVVGSYDWLVNNDHNMGTKVDWLGARVIAISEVIGKVPDIDHYGVVVVSVEENSLAHRSGLQKGHVIWNIRPIPPQWLTQRPGIVIQSPQDMLQAMNQNYPVQGFEFPARMPRGGHSTVTLKFN